jgi:hypothetical protein
MPDDTVRPSSTASTANAPMAAIDQPWNLSKRLDELQRGLTVALGILEDLVRRQVSSLVVHDDDS